MKLISYKRNGQETWGAVIGSDIVDLAQASGCATLAAFIASPAFGERDTLVKGLKPVASLPDVELLPVIPQPEKIVCAVRNYMDHHKEVLAAGMQRELSEEPPIFLRVWRSQVAHGQAIVRPRESQRLEEITRRGARLEIVAAYDGLELRV